MRKTNMRRILIVSLILAMLMGIMTIGVMAAEGDATTYVAKIGETKYETLAKALAAAKDGDVITVLVDEITLANSLVITKNITIEGTFTLNGTLKLEKGVTLTAPAGLTVKTNTDNTYYEAKFESGVYSVYNKVTLPEAEITDIKNSLTENDPDLTFALNFTIKGMKSFTDDYIEALLDKYGDWYTDYVLTISGLTSEKVIFNANGGEGVNGYLAGKYKAWSESWVSVPFENVAVENGESLYIMEYAASLMGQSGLRFTLAEIAAIVQDFDCGVYFTPEFLAANPNMKVELSLVVFEEDEAGNKIFYNNAPVAKNNFDVEDVAVILSGEDKQTKYFESFAAAYAKAEEGDTITLLKDVKLTTKLTITKAITIDGNGHSIIADETAVWYTVSGKFNIKNYTTHLIGLNSDGIVLKDVVLDCNNNAAGINIYCAQNVVFDNVSVINATKGYAGITVNGSTVTFKTALTVLGNSVALDISNGSGVTSTLGVTVEEGTVFDLGNKTVKFASVANVESLVKAVNAEGASYFAAKDNAYFYTIAQMQSSTNTYSNGLTLLADVTLTNQLKVKGELDLNGHTFNGTILLASKTDTLIAPENLNVTTNVEGYSVVYQNGTWSVCGEIDSVAVNGSYTYNGSEQTAEITVKIGNVVLTSNDYIVSGNKATNAGTYTITVTGTGKYQGTVTVEWTIAKKSVTVNVDNKTMIAGNALPEFTATVVGCIDGEALVYTAETVADGKAEGAFAITADYTENANYDVTVVPGTLTVSKALVRAYAKTNAKCKYFDNIADALEYTMGYNDYGPVYVLDDITVDETIVFNDSIANKIELQGEWKVNKYPTVTCTADAGPFIKMEAGKLSVKNLVIETVGDAFLVTGGELNLQSAGGSQTLKIISQNGSCLVVEGGSTGVFGAVDLKSKSVSAIKGSENGTGQVTVGLWSNYTSTPSVVAPEGVPAIGGLDSEDVSLQSGSFSSNVSDFCGEGYTVTQKNDFWGVVKAVVKNSTTGKTYGTLAEAIAAAQAGQTITFLADINENVTIDKTITIDGADKNYTGKMTIAKQSVNIVLQNINFVKGQLYSEKDTSEGTTLKLINCDLDGQNSIGHAMEIREIEQLIIEGGSIKNYTISALYVPSAHSQDVIINGTTIESIGSYAIRIASGAGAQLIGVTIKNVYGGLLADTAKEYTFTNCVFENVTLPLTSYTYTLTGTFIFNGENKIPKLSTSAGGTFLLAAGATLTAPEGLTNIDTNVEGYKVVYAGGAYTLDTIKFKTILTNIRMGETFSHIFATPKIDGICDKHYAVITIGEGEEKITVTVPFAEWKEYTIDDVKHYVIEYEGLSAKQMVDQISIQFFLDEGEADPEVSNGGKTTSIKVYAQGIFATANDAFKTVIVDMLNYGAAAQTYFDYKTDTLANAGLSPEQKALATEDYDECEHNHNRVGGGNINLFFMATSVRFDDSISLVFKFDLRGYDISTMKAVFEYFDHNGNKQSVDATFEAVEGEVEGIYAVELDTLVIADAHQTVTCEISEVEGGSTYIVDSIAGYVARRVASNKELAKDDPNRATEDAVALYKAFMMFADSAYAYKHPQQQ